MAKKNTTFKARNYYDGGLVYLKGVPVPSKRVGYKKVDGVLIANVPIGVPKFNEYIKSSFAKPIQDWPLEERLLVGIALGVPEKEFKVRDVDNMAKTILDAFKGIAYEDDCQIESLFVSKAIMPNWDVWIAIKKLDDDTATWFIEPFLETTPEDKV